MEGHVQTTSTWAKSPCTKGSTATAEVVATDRAVGAEAAEADATEGTEGAGAAEATVTGRVAEGC